jgi:hypothetical protein
VLYTKPIASSINPTLQIMTKTRPTKNQNPHWMIFVSPLSPLPATQAQIFSPPPMAIKYILALKWETKQQHIIHFSLNWIFAILSTNMVEIRRWPARNSHSTQHKQQTERSGFYVADTVMAKNRGSTVLRSKLQERRTAREWDFEHQLLKSALQSILCTLGGRKCDPSTNEWKLEKGSVNTCQLLTLTLQQ